MLTERIFVGGEHDMHCLHLLSRNKRMPPKTSAQIASSQALPLL